ncbi:MULTISPECIES: tripartite tricarboxylate transporter substrate binding protein [unclassified Cupriavidus]|uniref:Bug family tripartite tricarboxylate transporter substrate binding protein n=1 Tax=unclassified Cupriavidus TaxID=2640874 RepID=UPI001485B646|nr:MULTISPECIES: tripartite tricarboxylate transporter substrate binding protein [unclassified Cupriavidus]
MTTSPRHKAIEFLKAGAIAAVMLTAGAAQAADWPAGKPITLIVPAAAGSTPDQSSRKLAQYLGEKLGTSVVVDNRPGAAGSIAMQTLVRSKPDGYTIGFGNIVTMAINRSLLARPGYDADKDLVPVSATTTVPNILAVNAGLPIRSVKELIDYARKNPGKLTMGSGGNGTTSHLSGEMLRDQAHIDFRHIPYRGAPQAQIDVISGQVDFMFDNVPSILSAVQGNKLRAIAVTSKSRLPVLPNVPTMDESGLPGFEVNAWGGIVAPAGTPRPVVERLNREINAYLQLPATRKDAEQNGSVVVGGSPEAFAQMIAKESRKWGDLIRKANIKLD